MAPEVVAEGVVLLRLQESIDRDMQAAQRKLERKLEDLDGKEANLRVNVRDKEALKELDAIEKRVEEHQEALNAAEAAGDRRSAANAKARLRRAKKAQDEWRESHADLNRKLADLDKQRQRAVEDHEARLADIQRKGAARREDIQRQHQAKVARDQAKADRDQERQAAKADRDKQRDLARRLREERTMLREHAVALREDERRNFDAATAAERRALEEAKLNQELVKQIRHLNRLHRTRRPLRQEHAAQYDIDVSTATAKVAALQAQIRAIGAEPVELRVNVNRTLASRLEDTTRRIADFAGGFRNIAVRVGPFTTSMGVLLKALVVLGPVITSLIGSLAALAGAMGAGLIGTVTLAGGAFTGFGLSMLGMILAIKPAIAEINNAVKASAAYEKAVREHGKGSDQAAAKLKVFNNVMKNQSAEARRNYLAAGKMTEAWKELTAPARQTAFEVMGRGIRFASDNMEWFAQRTNTATKEIGDGLSRWMDRLSSAGGRSVLTNIFDNWNASLGPLMNGLGNVAAYLGKVFSQASNHLPGLVRTFERWSDNLNRGFDGGAIDRLVEDAKTLGRFLLAGGRALRTFFNLGREGGGNFLRDMTQGLDRWRAYMEGPGAAVYRKFFDDARQNVEALWSALGPIFGQFISWATAITPAITGFLQGLAVAASLVAGLLNGLTKVGSTLFGMSNAGSTLVATFAAIWALGKVTAFAAGVMKVGAALKGIVTVLAVVRAAIAATFAMGSLRAGLGVISAASAASRAGMAGAGMGAMAMSGPMIAATAAVVGLGIAFTKNANDSNKWLTQSNKIRAANKDLMADWDGLSQTVDYNGQTLLSASRGVGDAERNLRDAQKEVKAAQGEVNALREAGKTKTDAYKDAVDRLNDAEQRRVDASADLYAAEQRRTEARKAMMEPLTEQGAEAAKVIRDASKAMRELGDYEVGDALQRAVGAGGNFRDVLQDVHDISRETGRDWREVAEEFSRGDSRSAKAMRDYLALSDQVTAARKEQKNVAAQQLLADLNIERAGRRFASISANAAKHFASIAAQAGKIGRRINVKIATTYEDPGKAARVAQGAANAIKRGVQPRIVFDIIARGGPAKRVLDELDSRKPKDKTVKIKGDKGEADRDLDAVDRRKPKSKVVPIGGNPGLFNQVWGVIGNLRQSLTVLIKGDHSPLQALWNTLSGWAKTIWVNIAGRKNGYTGGVFNEGGVAIASRARGGVQSQASMVENAYRRAATSGPQRTRGGRYSKPTLLVGEEDRREYVIATNPAYRESNMRYLQQAAGEFGFDLIDAAAGGKGGGKGGKGRKGKGRKKLKIPTRYKAGSVDANEARQDYNKAKNQYESRERQLRNAEEMLDDHIKSKSPKKTLDNDRRRIDRLRKGGKGEASLVQLRRRMERNRALWKATQKIQNQIDAAEARVEKERSVMERNSILFEATGNAENQTAWANAKTRRETQLTIIKNLYAEAAKHAKGKRKRELEKMAEAAHTNLTASQFEASPAFQGPEIADLSTLLRTRGREGELAGLQNALAYAKAMTPTDITDDIAAAESLVKFYEDFYGSIAGDPSVNIGTKTEALDALAGARGELDSLRGGGPGAAPEGPTQGQLLNTERMSLLRDFASNAYGFGVGTAGAAGPPGGGMGLNPSSLANPYAGTDRTRTPTNISGQSSGGAGASRTITVNNTFATVPPDPHTWSRGVEYELGTMD